MNRNRVRQRDMICIDRKDLEDLFIKYEAARIHQLFDGHTTTDIDDDLHQAMLDFYNKYVKIKHV